MTVDRLRGLLATIGPPVTPLELAEMIWLAGQLPAEGLSPLTEPSGDVRAADAVRLDDVVERTGQASRRGARRDAASAEPRQPLHHPGPAADRTGADSASVLAPAAPVLGHPLAIQRALRPLKRSVVSRRDEVLDEEASAARIAEQGGRRPWIPVLMAARERWLGLALVIDTGSAMSVWQPLAGELQETMLRLGAFRDVRVWFVAGTADGVGVRTSSHAPAQAPASLLDPTGRQAVLILSDCSGTHWWNGRMASAVHGWATLGPTAILQPLPERLWRRTAVPTVPGRAVLTRPGAPNTGLRFVSHDGSVRRQPGALPVPVIELSEAWIGDWARLTAGSGGQKDTAMAFLSARAAPSRDPLGADRDLPARDRVLRFRAVASPEAVELAGHTAVAVPAVPVMRLIQRRILRGSQPSDLAEVLLSGLLSPVTATPGLYEFAPGARAALLETLPRAETLATADTLEQISAEIQARAGTEARAFQALMPVVAGTGSLAADPGQRPFAFVSQEALSLLNRSAVPPSTAPEVRALDVATSEEGELETREDATRAVALRPSASRVQRIAKRNPAERATPPAADDPRIMVLGSRGSGKTAFIASLPIAFTRRHDLGWVLVARTEESARAAVSFTNDFASAHIFPPPGGDVQEYNWELQAESARREWGLDGYRRRRQVVRLPLNLVEAPDDLEGPPFRHAVERLGRADGVILIIDPTSESINDYFVHVYRWLTSLIEFFPKAKVPHYVAVCITKFDDLRVFQSAVSSEILEFDDEPPEFPRVPGEYAMEFLETILGQSRAYGADLILPLIRQTFHEDRVRFFVTSAVGFYVDHDLGVFDRDDYQNWVLRSDAEGRDRIRGGVNPINVIEPILWLTRSILRATNG